MRYPFAEYEKDAITSKTGKKFTDITLEEVMKGHIAPDDIKISKDMLKARVRLPGKRATIPWRKISSAPPSWWTCRMT